MKRRLNEEELAKYLRKPTKAQVRCEAEFNREVQEAIMAVRSTAMVDDHLSSDVSNGSCQSKGSRGSSPCQKECYQHHLPHLLLMELMLKT